MEFQSIDRTLNAFQEPVSADQLLAMCHRAFGAATKVLSAVVLGGGSYNNTYRVDIANRVQSSFGLHRNPAGSGESNGN